MAAVLRIADVAVHKRDGVVLYAAGLAIDCDGAFGAYHPPTAAKPNSGRPPGLDDLRNAGGPGDWYGVVTRNGEPVLQGPGDPCPGFYVSPTALAGAGPASDPRSYVDSSSVPYIAVPGGDFCKRLGLRLGDLAVALYRSEGSYAIVADIGPRAKIGEGSIALATALHLFRGVNAGYERRDVVYVVLAGTRATPPWPRSGDEMHAAAWERFETWGGRERVQQLLPGVL